MPKMTVEYQARQQFRSLSKEKKAELKHVLTNPDATGCTDGSEPNRFVSRLEPDMKVYWEKKGDGRIAVLSVVRQTTHEA